MPQLSPKTTVISTSWYEGHEGKHWKYIRILGSQDESSDIHISPFPHPANAGITNGIWELRVGTLEVGIKTFMYKS